MPHFLREILIKITGYGWLALLAGVGLLGMAGYYQFKATGDHAYVAQDKLTLITGKVTEGREITVTSKRKRGSSRVSDRYYELDVKPETGELQKLRISLSVPKAKVESTLATQITAAYDPEDNNIVYSIKQGANTVLDYETTKARLVSAAESSAKSTSGFANIIGSIALILLGVGAMFANRKLKSVYV